jgi:hypothetical protein
MPIPIDLFKVAVTNARKAGGDAAWDLTGTVRALVNEGRSADVPGLLKGKPSMIAKMTASDIKTGAGAEYPRSSFNKLPKGTFAGSAKTAPPWKTPQGTPPWKAPAKNADPRTGVMTRAKQEQAIATAQLKRKKQAATSAAIAKRRAINLKKNK